MLQPPWIRQTSFIVKLAIALLAVTAVETTVANVPPARAGAIAQRRAEATRVAAQIQAFDMKLEANIQRYDGAVAHLGGVRTRIRVTNVSLRVAQANLRRARHQLQQLLVGVYKQGQSDPAAIILASASLQELLDNVDVMNRTTGAETDLLRQVSSAEKQVLAKRAALKVEAGQAQRLVTQAAAAKRHVLSQLSQRRRMLATIKAGIRRLIHQQEERQARLASQRAARSTAPTAPTAPPTAPTGPIPPANSTGQQAVAIAERYLGVPYVWGGATPSGFDCSGLTMYVYAQLGIQLSHYTGDQWNEGVHVSQDQLMPGDLVFFDNLGHEGMYIGGGQFIHAPHTGDVVKISSMSEAWYASTYDGAVRVTG